MKQKLLLISLLFSTSMFCAQAEDVTTTIEKIVYTADSEGTTATVAQSKEATGDVVIPETVEIEGKTYTVTALADKAFMATALKGTTVTSVVLPSTITSIGEKAFNTCEQLVSVNIPEGVTILGTNMFNKCKSLTTISLPSTLTTIGNNAFKACAFESIVIPANVNSLGLNCFQDCKSLASVTLPAALTELSSNAFSGCSAITTIELPSGITKLGDGALAGTGITTIELPAGLTDLGQAFADCDKLVSIAIPDGVTSIAGSTFNRCTALESVTLGTGITAINSFAFNQCAAITSVTVNAVTPPTLAADAFPADVYANATVTVPEESRDAYKAADVWKTFSDLAGITEIVAGNKTIVESFTITGNRVSEGYRGIMIVRYSDGSVAKLLKR